MRIRPIARAAAAAALIWACAPLVSGWTAHASGPTITEFVLPTAGSHPSAIAGGPDGNMWLTESASNQVGKVTPAGAVTEYALPSAASGPAGIAPGPDGNIWFAESTADQIARVTPAGTVVEYGGLASSALPTGVTAGPDGNVWFTELGVVGVTSAKVGAICPALSVGCPAIGSIAYQYVVPTATGKPSGIAAGPDGNLWFAESAAPLVSKVTRAGAITEYPLPSLLFDPTAIVAGPDGDMWFTEADPLSGAAKVASIDPAGNVTETALPAGSQPAGIAAGPDGNLWVAERGIDEIARVSAAAPHAVTRYPLAVGSTPSAIAAGPDGNIWFTEEGTDRVARISIAACPSLTASPAVFSSNATERCFTVPAGVAALHIVAVGGAGGDGFSANPAVAAAGRGARGARVTGILAATPGQAFYVQVGGNGQPGKSAAGGEGGYSGGADGAASRPFAGLLSGQNTAGGGGGATDLRTLSMTSLSPASDTSLGSRVVVAAGGGGGGSAANLVMAAGLGGDGGAGGAAPGAGVTPPAGGGGGGAARTAPPAGGLGGSGAGGGAPGTDGLGGGGGGGGVAAWSLLTPPSPLPAVGGGGGGGSGAGYYGGGGGGGGGAAWSLLPPAPVPVSDGGGGGGAGSSFADPTAFSSVTVATDSSGTPSVTITWQVLAVQTAAPSPTPITATTPIGNTGADGDITGSGALFIFSGLLLVTGAANAPRWARRAQVRRRLRGACAAAVTRMDRRYKHRR